MKLSAQSHTLIESTIKEAISQFIGYDEQTVITDIHLLPKQDSGELCIFNDDEEELAKVIIEEWVDYNNEDFYQNTERILRATLNKLKEGGLFDHLTLLKPYSIVLVDEEKESIIDLLLMDDDTMLINDELLKGLDEELDDFLKKLLEN
ncbi:hypothetical protein [uncultured Bacteroides sp.]|uniref:hypothetical protein n=1 Tax=uncultured Bacteroides sp. TaxID=162156 RepID=UPI002AAC1EFE|nr:hypothetical protein [uncultured Bacteroides sp.]